MSHKDHLPSIIDNAPISRVWSPELPKGFAEPADREPYVPYEPTPISNAALNPMFEQVAAHQKNVASALAPLFDTYAPETVPDDVRAMISLDRLTGEVHRSTKNLFAYSAWGESLLEAQGLNDVAADYKGIEEARLGIIASELAATGLGDERDKLLLGTITPYEVLNLLRHTSLEAAEITKVTHPYGYRMAYVKEARKVVDEAIIAHDGVVLPRVLSTYQKIQLQPNFSYHDERGKVLSIKGFLATYKRPLGYVTNPEGRRVNIIERQSAALRIDEGSQDIPKGLAHDLRQPFESNDDWSRPLDELNKRTMYQDFFERSIQEDVDADFLVPLSTMVYAAAEPREEFEARREYESTMTAKKIARATIASGNGGMLFIGHDT